MLNHSGTVDRDQASYDAAIDERLKQLATRDGPNRLIQIVRGMEGASPRTVIDRLEALGIPWSSHTLDTIPEDASAPELHPLDFEWHFRPDAIRHLSSAIGSRDSLLIGLPNVAAVAESRPFTLIERNPFAVARRTEIARNGEAIVADIATVDTAPRRSVVAFDPPWYLGETLLWLSKAAQWVTPRGEILFTLFPRLVRPSATAERASILELCRQLGHVTIEPAVLQYTTPRFELEALTADGVPALNAWRRADLVRIEVFEQRLPLTPPMFAEPIPRDRWRTFVLGRQLVVKLRESDTRSSHTLVSPVPGVSNWTLPSVSLRDARRAGVDVWTSRNRVAKIDDFGKMSELLESLKTAADPRRVLTQWEQRGTIPDAQAFGALLSLE